MQVLYHIKYSHRLRPAEIENAADLFTHVIYTLYNNILLAQWYIRIIIYRTW